MGVAQRPLGDTLQEWAATERSVAGLVLIGSRARPADDVIWRPDAHSDWDFHVITARPELFLTAEWLRPLSVDVRAYAVKRAAIGQVPKITLLLGDTMADLVLLPQRRMQVASLLMRLGRHRRDGGLRRALQDLAVVIRPGWRFLKGEARWDGFLRRVVAEVPDPRLDDRAALGLANIFVCELAAARLKLKRGELIAAQRALHLGLGEPVLRLWHEARLRRGVRSFPEGRRIEKLITPAELSTLAISAPLEAAALEEAMRRLAAGLDGLMHELAGPAWQWPDRTWPRLGAEAG